MKRRFVGGILTNASGEVLLVGRSQDDLQMGGLWSLPAGGVEEGETPTEALVREFREETGLDVSVGAAVATVERPTWAVDVFRVTAADCALRPSTDADIAELRFFPLGGLPERVVLEAMMPLMRFRLGEGGPVSADAYTDAVEGLFSALFYSYLAPGLSALDGVEGASLIRYVILNTPYRKFKSCLPYLLADCAAGAKAYALASEAAFAVWTILDDLCDQRQARYRAPTTLARFGHRRNVTFLFLALKSLEDFLRRETTAEFSAAVVEGLTTCGLAEQQRFANTDMDSAEGYLSRSADRCLFLRRSWTEALRRLGRGEEADLMEAVHAVTSRMGQVINDLFDLRDGLEDFEARTVSYPTVLLKGRVGREPADLDAFTRAWEGRADDPSGVYSALLRSHGVDGLMQAEVLRLAGEATDTITASAIDPDKKEVLTAWVAMGFRHVPLSDTAGADPDGSQAPQGPQDYAGRLTAFVGALDRLCANID